MKSILCTLFSNALCCANDRALLEISVAITEALGLSLASDIAIAPDPVPNSKILQLKLFSGRFFNALSTKCSDSGLGINTFLSICSVNDQKSFLPSIYAIGMPLDLSSID